MNPDILSSKINQEILRFLCEHPNDSFYSSQIAQKTGFSVGGVNQALHLLAKNNLLKTDKKGRMTFYQANASSPIIRQFKVFRTILSLDPLVKKLQPYAEKAVLFGSSAEGTNTEDSDIDLLVISNQKEDVNDALNKFKSKHKIQFILKSPQEYISLEKKEPVFFAEIEKGTPLWQKV
jgi:predicted nucleotidyltransferase